MTGGRVRIKRARGTENCSTTARCSLPAHERYATRRLPKCRPTGILSARPGMSPREHDPHARALSRRSRARPSRARATPSTLLFYRNFSASTPSAPTCLHRRRLPCDTTRHRTLRASGPRRLRPLSRDTGDNRACALSSLFFSFSLPRSSGPCIRYI